jgi:hypothetical protein
MNFWQYIPRPIIGLAHGRRDRRSVSLRHREALVGPMILTEFVNIQSAIYAPELLLKDFTYTEIERPVGTDLRQNAGAFL